MSPRRATITTKSGTVYELDLDEKTVTWPGRQYVGVYVIDLHLGRRFEYVGRCVNRTYETSRSTTPVLSIEWHT